MKSKLKKTTSSNGSNITPINYIFLFPYIDTVEEIIDYIDAQYPTKNRINDATLNESVDKLTRNFFSKFCFYIKSVSKDSSALVSELHRLDDLLKRTTTR